MKKLILVVILVIVAAGGFYLYQKFTQRNPDLNEVKSEMSTTADSLVAAFIKDSAAASRRFIDHVITVSGTVSGIDSQFKPAVISLSTADPLSRVQCSMDSSHATTYARLREGTPVKIRGYCVGYNTQELIGTDVTLNRCVMER